MKPAQLCRCGRSKSEHYVVTIRRKRRKLPDCEKFRPAPGPTNQLILNMPDADHPQLSPDIVFAHENPSNQKNS